MTYEPNLEAARDSFAQRVTQAYIKTWQAYGFVGEEFSEEAAKLLGTQLAKHAFPLTAAPVILQLDVDTAGIREALEQLKNPGAIQRIEPMTMTYNGYGELCGDGVVGD